MAPGVELLVNSFKEAFRVVYHWGTSMQPLLEPARLASTRCAKSGIRWLGIKSISKGRLTSGIIPLRRCSQASCCVVAFVDKKTPTVTALRSSIVWTQDCNSNPSETASNTCPAGNTTLFAAISHPVGRINLFATKSLTCAAINRAHHRHTVCRYFKNKKIDLYVVCKYLQNSSLI
jgi:hypothetical protein